MEKNIDPYQIPCTKRIFRSNILRSYKALEEILAYVSLYGMTAKIKTLKKKLIELSHSKNCL